MIDLVIVGSGAVAEGLRVAVEATDSALSGLRLVQCWARGTHTPAELAPADLYILAVGDSAIAEAATAAADGSSTGIAGLVFPSGSVVAHTAGGVSVDELSPTIVHRAVLYPLQSFTRGRRIEDFRRRVPFFIEGTTPHALETVRTAAGALSDNVTQMPSPQRAHLHLAAAVANNFSNAMFSLAAAIAADAGVPFESLKPLIAETAAKAVAMPSPEAAQTGPAARGDDKTVRKHLEILQATHPEMTELYKEISKLIWKISKKN